MKDIEMIKREVEAVRDTLKELYNNIGNETEEQEENGETFSEYIYDVLDIKYILNRDKTLSGVRLLVAFGGPNIWIDTSDCTIRGYWGGQGHTCEIFGEIAEEIDSYFEFDI